jgi:hypothetical protein
VADPSSTSTAARVPASTQARINADFRGTSSPAIVAFSFPPSERRMVEQAAKRLETLAAADGTAHPPFTTGGSLDGRAGTLELPLAGLGDDAASKHALSVLRTKLIPQTLGRVPGVQVASPAMRPTTSTSPGR